MQGVGLGLILLQTLSRLHVTVTLAFSQILGAAVVMIARATAPDALGPGTVFPDVATWNPSNGLSGSPMVEPLFWVCLICQLIIVAGYFWFYRREELGKLAWNSLTLLKLLNSPLQRDHNYHKIVVPIIRRRGRDIFTCTGFACWLSLLDISLLPSF